MRLFSRICLTGYIFLLFSCGARKRAVDTSIIRNDVVTRDNFDLSKVSDKTSMVLQDDFKFTLEPIDPALPIIYKHDTIYNSKVIYQRVLRDSIVRIRDTVYIKEVSVKEDNSTIKEKKIDVESERGDPWRHFFLPFGIGLGIAVIVWVFYRKRSE